MDYELWIDEGSLSSEYRKLPSYIYATHLFTFHVNRVENGLTKSLNYRFKYRSRNAIGFSELSDSSRVALGPLPAKPNMPRRAILGNSPSSIGLEWDDLVGETLEVIEYRVYMDDGNGVIFNMIYRGIDLDYDVLNLTSGIAYSFKVSAVNFNGEGERSDPAMIKSCIVPKGVSAPVLVSSTSTTVSLRWTQPVSNGGCPIISYAILRDDGANGDFLVNMEPLAIANNPYLFEHVFTLPVELTGLNVRFKLLATNERGSTISGDFISALIAGLPDKPTMGP